MEKLSSWRDLRNFSTNRCILNFEQNARYRSKRLIFIYRPSNASIIWTHNGGCIFINQHDFVGFIAISSDPYFNNFTRVFIDRLDIPHQFARKDVLERPRVARGNQGIR